MKNIKMLTLFFLVFCNTVHPAVLDQIVIEKKAVLIEKKMTQDRYFFYGLTAASLMYQLSVSFSQVKHAYDTNASETSSQETSSQEKLSIMQRLQTLPQACKAGLQYLVFTKEGWIATATATAQICVGIGSSIFVSKLCEKLAHPDTLRWYIHTYAPYHLTIKLIKERLLKLQDISLAELASGCGTARKARELELCNELIPLLYESLVRQGLSICAYVTYKTKYLDEEEKALAERLKIFMIASQNRWFDCLAAQFAADNPDSQAIIKLIDAYEADIASQINQFAILEGETPHDRIAVNTKKEAPRRQSQ